MSYILDALRRAEADRERERGQVPGLHTHAQPGRDTPAAAGRHAWWPWAGAALLLLIGLGAGSWWASSPQPAAPPAPAYTPAPAATTASPPTPAEPVAVAPQSTASASPYLPPAPTPVAMAAVPAPRPASTAAPAAEERIPRVSELPEALRRELPPLTLSGSVYSDDPASRFVMINGEAVREGAKLGAELVLERIGPRELVLRFRGQRYRQPV